MSADGDPEAELAAKDCPPIGVAVYHLDGEQRLGLMIPDGAPISKAADPKHGEVYAVHAGADELGALYERIEDAFGGRDAVLDASARENIREGIDPADDTEIEHDGAVVIRQSEHTLSGTGSEENTMVLEPGDTLEIPASAASSTVISVSEDLVRRAELEDND